MRHASKQCFIRDIKGINTIISFEKHGKASSDVKKYMGTRLMRQHRIDPVTLVTGTFPTKFYRQFGKISS